MRSEAGYVQRAALRHEPSCVHFSLHTNAVVVADG